MSKHEEILKYIEQLEIGRGVSVRSIATRMKVADGTAYRAIKEAENQGLVAVNDRSGTVRVAAKNQKLVNRLTFGKVAEICNAEIVGGRQGINVEFSHFVISAMTLESVKKYLVQHGLVITGDREDVQTLALHKQNAVLVTGGFHISDEVKNYANQFGIPLMATSYDTFTVASRISHALSNELIKKDIITVEEAFRPHEPVLDEFATVKDFMDLYKKTNNSRFAVVNKYKTVVGVIAMRDVAHKSNDTLVDKLMTRNPSIAKLSNTVASISQKMIYEGFEMMPVVNDDFTYAGIISKSDVLQALQKTEEENQFSHTFSEDIASKLKEKGSAYQVIVDPSMINSIGTVSNGVISEIVTEIAGLIMTKRRKRNIFIQSLNMNYMSAVAIDNVLDIYSKVISETRHGAMIDFEVYHINTIVAKVIVSLQTT